MKQPTEFRLKIKGPGQTEEHILQPGTTTIGRQMGCEVHLNHDLVSRRHAVIHNTGESCQIADLGSVNGTRVNGKKITPQVPVLLNPGAVIRIGEFELIFEQVMGVMETTEVDEAQVQSKSQEKVETVIRKSENAPEEKPPSIPPPGQEEPMTASFDPGQPPPGLTMTSRRLLGYLPGIYHTDFMARFLAIFEAILFPLEWQIDNFDLYLSPTTSPTAFLPWLEQWFSVCLDINWSEQQRRIFLQEAHHLFARRGTSWGLKRVLEIFTGQTPEIVDQSEDLAPFTFKVNLPVRRQDFDGASIERLINAYKPAHTTFVLEFTG